MLETSKADDKSQEKKQTHADVIARAPRQCDSGRYHVPQMRLNRNIAWPEPEFDVKLTNPHCKKNPVKNKIFWQLECQKNPCKLHVFFVNFSVI